MSIFGFVFFLGDLWFCVIVLEPNYMDKSGKE